MEHAMHATRRPDPSLVSGIVPPADRGGEGAARIGAATLDPERVAAFNAVLLRLCPRARPLLAGQIAAAARRLLFTDARERGVESIARRLSRLAELEAMRADAGFALDADAGARIRELLAYVERGDDLIPDDVPVVGQLDDAILADLLLRELGPALGDYADYLAWRADVAARAGVPVESLAHDCDDWLEARRREIEAVREQRRGSYAAQTVERGFRIG
jgi:uncharacterized membrane protein YkvA (DUF1232 family)